MIDIGGVSFSVEGLLGLVVTVVGVGLVVRQLNDAKWVPAFQIVQTLFRLNWDFFSSSAFARRRAVKFSSI